jgi:high affinity Mn2+ porin
LIGAALALLAFDGVAAADAPAAMPVKGQPVPGTFDWTGFYFGEHVGYSRGTTRAIVTDPDPSSFSTGFGRLSAGLHLGYNQVLPSRVVLGVEVDASFLNYLSNDDLAFNANATTNIVEKIDVMGTVRGRIGYAFDRLMVYATGGPAWALGRFLQSPGAIDDTDKVLQMHFGWSLGAGAAFAVAPRWSVRLEYLYRNFGHVDVVFPSGSTAASSFDIHALRAGLDYKLAGPGIDPATEPQTQFANWEIHGQTTYIQQGYPPFRAPYTGDNSFTPWAQTRNTTTFSAFLGLKPWDSGEIYYNGELFQGFGLHDTTGAAGYPNGEAQKSNFAYPHYDTSRLFLRQAIGFGGEQEKVESSYGQMAGTRDISRLTFQVGKFAVHDMFDNNAYAQDSRNDFMNWSIWAAGAFDYPADLVGLTYGAVAELNQKDWALRAGYFLTGNQPNSNEFDTQLFSRGGYVGELETRYAFLSRPGKLRVGLWADTYLSGSYREAVDLSAVNPGLTPTDAIMLSWKGRTKYGYYLNVEQSVTDEIGAFGRWSWNNGKTEISAFTDIDWSLSGGLSINGKSWGRPDDKIGMAGAINGLSADHRDYLAAGGLGILIGDGRLNYRPEQILETFYAMNVVKGVTLTADYQFMVNPADNADRGPISFFSARLHAEF